MSSSIAEGNTGQSSNSWLVTSTCIPSLTFLAMSCPSEDVCANEASLPHLTTSYRRRGLRRKRFLRASSLLETTDVVHQTTQQVNFCPGDFSVRVCASSPPPTTRACLGTYVRASWRCECTHTDTDTTHTCRHEADQVRSVSRRWGGT